MEKITDVQQPETGNQTENFLDIDEADPVEMERKLLFLNLDFQQLAVNENTINAEIRKRVWKRNKGYNAGMRSEVRRLQSFFSYRHLSTWCPKKMARAGLYFTGEEHSIQCFCCGLIICTTSMRTFPYEKHIKYNPSCAFIQGKDTGNIPKYEVRVQQPEINQIDIQNLMTEESRLLSFACWPFYSRIRPADLARAGFVFTGRRDSVQCFSCGGCLCHWEENDDPWREHAKWFPWCNFLQSKLTPAEVRNYIKSYVGFAGYTGKNFTTILGGQTLPSAKRHRSSSIFEDEGVRLDSFKSWPQNAHANPMDLARVGFYYIGISDIVKCFTCGICLHLFEPGDVPHVEHLKYSPQCEFLHKLEQMKDTEIEQKKEADNGYVQMVYKNEEQNITFTKTGLDLQNEHSSFGWENLRRQLVETYNSSSFSNLSLFPDSSHLSIDLKSLFADISVVLKDTRNQPVRQLTLPDIMSILSDITMIEGEAGSGKTALLRKIAILWASGTCPILSRFCLVFYISVSSTENQQTLSDIIREQLSGSTTLLDENVLEEIISQLGNQVLFLLDDYNEMDLVPGAIDDLLLKNPANRVSVAVTVRNGMGRKLRQLSRTELSIQEFPLYSSLYIYRRSFSHDIEFLEHFVLQLVDSNTLQAALKTPLFAFSLCVYWVENPSEILFDDAVVCKRYLMHIMLKHSKLKDKRETLVSACGELALHGLFRAQFDFTDKDLCAFDIDTELTLKCGLLSKFTSQRLRPIYKFFHPTFLEFLAGKRLSQYLDSTDKDQLNKGISFLQQINNITKFVGRYYVFLKYCCFHSPGTALLVISYLFDLLNKSEAFDYEGGVKSHFEHHPELAWREDILTALKSNKPDLHLSFVVHMLLNFAIDVAYKSNYVDECAPIILQYLTRKDICVDLSHPSKSLLIFLSKYPEGLSMINSLELLMIEPIMNKVPLGPDFGSHLDVPTVDKDYSKAFMLSDEAWHSDVKNYFVKSKINISEFGLNQSHHKIAVLQVNASGEYMIEEPVLNNLSVFLSLSHHIELSLKSCPGFVRNISHCIEQYKNSFVKCRISTVELTTEEQKLITQMSTLQSLHMINIAPPEYILSHLDKFTQLKELKMDLADYYEVFDMMSDGFKKLHYLEKLMLRNVNLANYYHQLADCISCFPNLTTFHLNGDWCPNFEKTMGAIIKNGNICELNLYGLLIKDSDIFHLVSGLFSLKKLKVLNLLSHHFVNVEDAKIFVQALSSLVQLEYLALPSGPGITETITSIIEQFQFLPNLMELRLQNHILNDHSLLELATAARKGFLNNIQILNLGVNHDITQSGWRDFFQTLDNLPHLNELFINRLHSHQFKTDASTLHSIIQRVSRLHSLSLLDMHGWLLDKEDLEMFNSMKRKHPQGKSFALLWQWILPVHPIVID
ncbi:baculoviral IAP repeat-containing 1 [Pelobates cultripes]|uniref:Baculoviral IAP repeat-containing 1 n=1 Tax=Pelobates cultripes TaxID=61616 RepID=A0AAD1SES0_PELCU|nr:baculoviral IAP repeat-containing 1 [Pelobates cultripes]